MDKQLHTQGPWMQDGHYVITQGESVIAFCGANEEDARRIVACVNACAGIETEMLEKANHDGIEPAVFAQTLIEQRGELLSVLKDVIRELHACQAVIHLHGGFDPEYVKGAQIAIKNAEAAIAKVEAA